MTVSKIPLILVTGFLGAGKTTFIKKIIDRLSDEKKIGIIQNEFAKANIDAEELRSSNHKFDIIEINGGAVFCICLIANFIDALSSFIDEINPEVIIVEASGLSDPVSITELFQHDKLAGRIYLSHVWCIIDSENYLKTGKMMNRIQRQVMISDSLIINKTDIGKDNIPFIKQELLSLNHDATILETSYCDINLNEFTDLVDDETGVFRLAKRHNEMVPLDRPEIFSMVLKTTRPISMEGLKRFLGETEDKLIRLKGFVMLNDGTKVKIHSGFGKTTIEEIPWYKGSTELIGLGYHITAAEFGRKFHDIRKVT